MTKNAEMLRSLPKEITDREYPSRISGWSEYHFSSLMERARRFASDYCDHYRWTFGIGISFDYDASSDEFATIFRMRRSADVWGVSYPVYLEVSFQLYRNAKYAERLSVPNLIFAHREDTPTWRKRFAEVWDERQYAECARLSQMPQFWLENDRGLPAQGACRRRLINVAGNGRRYQYMAETFAIENRMVPVADILNAITDPEDRAEVLSAVRANVAGSRTVLGKAPVIEQGDLLQTCFGLPRTPRGSESPCSACAHQKPCLRAADLLMHGS